MLDAPAVERPQAASPSRFIPRSTEAWLVIVILLFGGFLGLATDTFLTLTNLFDLLNISAFNVILAVGPAGRAGRRRHRHLVRRRRLGRSVPGGHHRDAGRRRQLGDRPACSPCTFGFMLGAINAGLIYYFRIISIVVTIATFNIFFGLLMFLTHGRSIYNLPDWWLDRIIIVEFETADGVRLPDPAGGRHGGGRRSPPGSSCNRTSLGRQLYAMGDNPDGARRVGINIAAMHFLAYGWLGICAGIGGLMQAHYVQEVVPNALYGRELDVLAAVVLGGARLGGGQGDHPRQRSSASRWSP